MPPSSIPAGPQATVCTVLTPAHLEFGALNRRLVQTLNPAFPLAWSITFNPGLHSPGDEAGATAAPLPPELAAAFPEAGIRIGPTLQQVFDEAFADPAHADTPAAERRRLLRKYLGSYHHGAGLRQALAAVRTRYAIIMDPDFYVVRPGWVEDVLGHMAGEGLAVFGAPWNPRWYQKYRRFPCTHLMVIDLEQAPSPGELLAPDLVGGGRRFASEMWTRHAAARSRGGSPLLRTPWRAVAEDLRQRASIGSARDTGYRLMQAFAARRDLRSGLVQAVFSPDDGFMPPAVSRVQRHPVVEALLPDRLRYLPRRREGWTGRGFSDFGYPSFRERGWEEFLWRGAPFAVHVRGELQRRPGGRSVTSEDVRTALEAVLERLGEPPACAPGLEPSAAIP